MDFVKNGQEFKIMVEGEEVGRIHKDAANWNYMYAVRIDFYFMVKGNRNSFGARTWKAAKVEAAKQYKALMDLNKRYGHEILYTAGRG